MGNLKCQAYFKTCPNGFLNIFRNLSFRYNFYMNHDHGFYLPNVKTRRCFANGSLSNCARTKEQSWG